MQKGDVVLRSVCFSGMSPQNWSILSRKVKRHPSTRRRQLKVKNGDNVDTRKLILSRKGFDTTSRQGPIKHPFGGVPSPIFPDGTMYSLPIPLPDEDLGTTYGDLYHGDADSAISIGRVVEDLTRDRPTRWTSKDPAWVSPDIREPFRGQIGGKTGMVAAAEAQQGHLRKQGVRSGDVFLFFGLFQRVELKHGRWRFVRSSPRQHILFGWLQVGSIHIETWDSNEESSWYVAAECLTVGNDLIAPGAGVFPSFDERLLLSKPGGSASEWRLPRWFYPEPSKTVLTYHPRKLWTRDDRYAYVQRRGPGQEFVLDMAQYPEALPWIRQLVHDLGAK